jgi:hypothetical protein
MAFSLPENIANRPITILGAGTLGSRIALMLATRGAEVRLYARSAAPRDAGVVLPESNCQPCPWILPCARAHIVQWASLNPTSKVNECHTKE